MSLESIALPFSETDDIRFETGRLAKQAAGSVVASLGGTMVLVTVTRTDKAREGADFFPLMVDYREKFYASGRIPGNFFRREGRPGDPETLKARVIDRCLRPLFPDGMRHEVMVYVTIISSDEKNQADVMAMNAASLALQLSDVPFPVPMAAVRVGMIDGEYVLNPPFEDENELDLDIIIAGTRDAINMVEAGANEVSEEATVKALEIGHEAIVKLIDGMKPLAKKAGKPKFDPQIPQISDDMRKKIEKKAKPEFEKMVRQGLGKKEYNDREHEIASAIAEEFITENPELSDPIKQCVENIHSDAVREFVTKEGKRVDGRKFDEIRNIETEVKVLPRAHGSALFVRGSTQALGVATLGTLDEAQKVDDLTGLSAKRFLMHYNFPPWSVGEARPMRGSSRREIGHGALAERALERLLPVEKDFPYTIRVVSEILESNGSSSMATVCAGCLALMDAGIPIRKPVAGIAMGLVEFEKEVAILTDIQGVEDHLGDMDFKVAGTRDGITALQMDIKMESVSFDVLKKALEQAKAARLFILDKMGETLSEARSELSENAPRMTIMKIPVEKIGAVIGPGGKVIRDITMRTGVKIDIQDDGTVIIATSDAAAADQAAEEVRALTAEVELNKTYNGKVVRVTDFGAFVQLLPNRDGLLHISEMDVGRVERVEDVCDVGDMLEVKVIEIDQTGRVRLSRRALLVGEDDAEARPRGGGGGDRGPRGGGDRDRGPRGGGDRDRGPRGGGGDRDRGPRGGGDRDRERPRAGGRDRDRESGGGDRERGERGGRDRDRESGGGEISYGFRERKRSSRDED